MVHVLPKAASSTCRGRACAICRVDRGQSPCQVPRRAVLERRSRRDPAEADVEVAVGAQRAKLLCSRGGVEFTKSARFGPLVV